MFIRIIKLVGSLVYFIIRIPFPQNQRGVILLYHNIKSNERQKFANQMDILINTTNPIFADYIEENKSNKKYAAVTFDDVNLGIIQNALPETEKRQIPITLFIPTGYIGKYPLWYTKKYKFTNDDRVINLKELKDLSQNNLIKFGSHTISHPCLTKLKKDEILKEINESKSYLENVLNQEIKLLSFPHGEYNNDILELCKLAGYHIVYSILPISTAFKNHEFVRGRIDVLPSDWPIEFKLKILNCYNWLPYAYKLKKKILLFVNMFRK